MTGGHISAGNLQGSTRSLAILGEFDPSRTRLGPHGPVPFVPRKPTTPAASPLPPATATEGVGWRPRATAGGSQPVDPRRRRRPALKLCEFEGFFSRKNGKKKNIGANIHRAGSYCTNHILSLSPAPTSPARPRIRFRPAPEWGVDGKCCRCWF